VFVRVSIGLSKCSFTNEDIKKSSHDLIRQESDMGFSIIALSTWSALIECWSLRIYSVDSSAIVIEDYKPYIQSSYMVSMVGNL